MNSFLFFKWLHIIAVISWMAGILYIFRLFIYHVKYWENNSIHPIYQIMQRRLLNAITIPAMIVAIFSAIAMLFLNIGMIQMSWLWIKVLFVLLLIGCTFYAKKLQLRFATETNKSNLPSEKFLRYANEGPTLLMLIIVWLVIFKPFGLL